MDTWVSVVVGSRFLTFHIAAVDSRCGILQAMAYQVTFFALTDSPPRGVQYEKH